VLLNSHVDELSRHLRHAVGLLKSREVPVDWVQLLHDIPRWDYPSRRVQRDWARAFWGHNVRATEEQGADAADLSSSTAGTDPDDA
jgi:CRISPR system Cascade subunit CasB